LEVASKTQEQASATIFSQIEQNIDNEAVEDHSHVEGEGNDSLLRQAGTRRVMRAGSSGVTGGEKVLVTQASRRACSAAQPVAYTLHVEIQHLRMAT